MNAPDSQPISVRRAAIQRVGPAEIGHDHDTLAVEEPMEIRLAYRLDGARTARSLSVTMRTPGDDFALAVGFLWTEGIVRARDDVLEVRFCGVPEGQTRSNVVRVELADHVEVDLARLERHFYTSSSCGVCGKTSLEAVQATGCPVLPRDVPALPASLIATLPDRLRAAQTLFEQTGGLHGTGWFDATGTLQWVTEDVGRHNALDKLVGRALLSDRVPLHDGALVVSGRASFELVQKAIMAGIPLMVAVGAPSSLAVTLAQAHGLTLVGFTKSDRFNIYSAPHRVHGLIGANPAPPSDRIQD